MKKLKSILFGLLILQVVIVGVVYLTGGKTQEASEPLLAFDKDKLDKLVIDDAELGNKVVVQKDNGQWQLPEVHNLPVIEDKVSTVLDSLSELRSNWPVATTKSSHERFKVAEDTYHKQVQLYQGKNLVGELLVGTSPGFKKAHLRIKGQDDVYAMKFNSYDYSGASDDWLDKSLLHLEDISSFVSNSVDLAKESGQWNIANLPEGKELKQDKAKELVNALKTLSVQEVLSQKLSAFPEGIKVTSDQGDFNYLLYKDDGNYAAQRSDRDVQFKISQYDYDRLIGVSSDSLLEDIADEDENSADELEGESVKE